MKLASVQCDQTVEKKFTKNWIVKQKVYNYNPVGFQGFAMNMRKPPFDDLRVRRAMAHLVDRKKMNSTIMYNQYFHVSKLTFTQCIMMFPSFLTFLLTVSYNSTSNVWIQTCISFVTFFVTCWTVIECNPGTHPGCRL